MSDVPKIHRSWDREKVRAHLEEIQAKIDRLQVIADAFQEAADAAERDVWHEKARLKSTQELFAAPAPKRQPS